MSKKPIRIYLADNSLYKTTIQLKKHWEQNPDRYELVCDPYWNPLKAEWANVVWIEWTEGAIQRASERKGFYPSVVSDHLPQPDRDYAWPRVKLINRLIDIEAYFGHFRQVQWENVDALAYIAKHVYSIVDKEMQFATRFPTLKTQHLPLSIDMNEWTYKKHGPGFNMAWINHNWTGKGLPLMLQALHKLVALDSRWHLHIVCDWSNEHWYRPYLEHIIDALGVRDNVTFYDKVDSVDQFLDGMDYVVSSSYKEAFSLIMAEAMAKGIKTLTHNWLGATDIWPAKYVWTTVDEFVEKILADDYNSEEYQAIAAGYDKIHEIRAADELMGLI